MSDAEVTSDTTPSKSGGNTLIIVIVVILIVAAIAFGIWWLIRRKTEKVKEGGVCKAAADCGVTGSVCAPATASSGASSVCCAVSYRNPAGITICGTAPVPTPTPPSPGTPGTLCTSDTQCQTGIKCLSWYGVTGVENQVCCAPTTGSQTVCDVTSLPALKTIVLVGPNGTSPATPPAVGTLGGSCGVSKDCAAGVCVGVPGYQGHVCCASLKTSVSAPGVLTCTI